MKKRGCTDGSDEENCEADCPEGMWKCKDGVTCINNDYVCDNDRKFLYGGRHQCPANSDEDLDVCYCKKMQRAK